MFFEVDAALQQLTARRKMRIREYTDSDLAALREIHATQGFGYAFPDLSNPLFVTKLILSTETDADPQKEKILGNPHSL